jgi:GPH family glycoside/pentoside/hexuronide:cation symporter
MLQLLQLSATFVTAPWDALLPEIAPSSQQRLSIAVWRVGFGTIGAGLGLVLSGLLVDQFGFAWMALVMALIALGAQYTALGGVWSTARASRPSNALPLRSALGTALANPSFRALILSFALFLSGLTMLIGLLPYYVVVLFGDAREGAWTAALTAASLAALIASIPLYLRLARRASKRVAYHRAMLLAALLFPLFAVAGFLPGVPATYQAILATALVGIPLGGVYIFPGPLMADVTDYEALTNGVRHEGVFFGAQVFVVKLAGALAPLLLGAILLLGRSSTDPLGVRLVGPAAALLALAGLLAFRGYVLPDEVTAPDTVVASTASQRG